MLENENMPTALTKEKNKKECSLTNLTRKTSLAQDLAYKELWHREIWQAQEM